MDDLILKYFVLKPGGNSLFAAASRQAMVKFAEVIRPESPNFADEVEAWAEVEQDRYDKSFAGTRDRLAEGYINKPLKARIFEIFGTQEDYAEEIGEDATTVSRVIRGRRELDPERQKKWAEPLGRPPEDFFKKEE